MAAQRGPDIGGFLELNRQGALNRSDDDLPAGIQVHIGGLDP
jgi:hypothetical protein